MVMYFRNELACAVGGRWVLSVARNVSSCPDASHFYQQSIDVETLHTEALGSFGVARSAVLLAGASKNPIGALAGGLMPVMGPIRVLELEARSLVGEIAIPARLSSMALDAQGEQLALLLESSLLIVDTKSGQERARVSWDDTRGAGVVAFCAGQWVVALVQGKKGLLRVISSEGGAVVNELPLKGDPYSISAAIDAPVVAVGVGRSRVQTVDLQTMKTQVVAAHSEKDRSAAVSVAITPDGTRVYSRSNDDARCMVLNVGDKEATLVKDLPASRTTITQGELLSSPAIVTCGSRTLVVQDGVPTLLT